MRDRRGAPNPHTVLAGLSFLSMGVYAFLPFDTKFTATLAGAGYEEVWGVMMLISGSVLALSSFSRNKYARFAGDFLCVGAGAWTFHWMAGQNVVVPTAIHCGLASLCCLWSLLLGAASRMRLRQQTGFLAAEGKPDHDRTVSRGSY